MEVQHWDLFGMLPYLVGCATKYILRHRSKGGKKDLDKAIHYIEKIKEQEYTEGAIEQPAQDLAARRQRILEGDYLQQQGTCGDHCGDNCNGEHVHKSLRSDHALDAKPYMTDTEARNALVEQQGEEKPAVGDPAFYECAEQPAKLDEAEAARQRADAYANGERVPGPTPYQKQFPEFNGEDHLKR